MKRLIARLALFAALFVAIDFAVGSLLLGVSRRTTSGNFGRLNYIADHTTAQVLLMGSSRCFRHYDPRVIEDSLRMTCYNAGRDANGIVMMYPFFKMIEERYRPRLLVYDLSDFDTQTDDLMRYLTWLRPFYGRAAVDSMACAVSPAERIKKNCLSYRLNGRALSIVADAVHPVGHFVNGYLPKRGTMGQEPAAQPVAAAGQKEIDPFKLRCLEMLIADCKRGGTQLVFAISPSYGRHGKWEYRDAVARLCRSHGLLLLDHYDDPRFAPRRQLFYDASHLNSAGADAYTRTIAHELRPVLHARHTAAKR